MPGSVLARNRYWATCCLSARWSAVAEAVARAAIPASMPADTAKRIKALRAELDISQAELARRLGVTPSTVARWEAGQSAPRRDIETIRRLAASNTARISAGIPPAVGVVAGPAAMGAALGAAGGPVGLVAGAALGALSGITLSVFLRNAARIGLSLAKIAELVDPGEAKGKKTKGGKR
jgi:transcriptional regulator with XRE-family HTH domain